MKRRPEFLRVAAARRKWAAPGLVLQAAPALPAVPTPSSATVGASAGAVAEAPPTSVRVGFTSSKKVGNAVARNRARRRLRAAAAQILPLCAAPGYDLVLIARKETVERSFALLLQDLQTALKRVGAHRDRGSGAKSEGRQSGREVP